jgi:phosphoserine phosphatase RsbU/P
VSDAQETQQIERSRRALSVLYNISIACRSQTEFEPIFTAIVTELRALFPFDACYIAVCDMQRPGIFRAALLVDQSITSYEEDTEYGVLTGMLVSTRQPLRFGDLARERQLIGGHTFMFGDTKRPSRAWMGVPLVLGEALVGVVSLQSYQPSLYEQHDVDLLQQVGNLVSVVLENAALGQRQRQLSLALTSQVAARTSQLAAIGELASAMVRGYPLRELLQRAIDRIVALFSFDAAIIRMIDTGGELELAAQHGMPTDYMRTNRRVPMQGTLLGKVIAENRVLAVGPEAALGLAERGLPFRSVLSVPMRIGDRVLGGMSLLCSEPRHFNEEEIDVALALANQVAIAIENARLFEERDRKVAELSALGAIARAASTVLDLQTLLRQVHHALSDLLPLDAFSMVVYDPERKIITDGVSIDEGEEHSYWHRQPPPRDSLTAWVIQNRRPLHFDDMAAEISDYPELARRHLVGSGRHAVSWIGVPLLNRANQAIGVVSLQSYSPHMFSDRDVSFLNGVAGQVALHVQNVALQARRERQIRELAAIGRISQQVSAAISLGAMLRPVYQTLQQVTGASSFVLLICDPNDQRIQHAYIIDGGEEIVTDWPDDRPPEGSLSAWILRSGEELIFDDLHVQQDLLQAIGVQPHIYGSDDRPRSWAGVPLLDGENRPIGVIAIQDSRSYQYDGQTVEFLSQVAAHISLGVQKAELFAAERAARRTADTLREVARVLNSSFDPDEVLQIILRELHHVVAYDTASIMLLDGPGLRVVALRGWTAERSVRGQIFPLDPTIAAARVVRERIPLVIPDTRETDGWYEDGWGPQIRAWLGVPLVAKGRVLGVLNIDSHSPNRFSARDVEVALAFASQAAVSLENARLYAESLARVEQELAIARQIQSNLFPRSLPVLPHVRIAARCLPARETGGDFYDCFTLAGDDGHETLALMVGDASGKSVPGAMLMAIARSVARSEARDHVEPSAVLRETNRLVSSDVPRGSFVALSYATIDGACRHLELASAGQIAPLLRRASGEVFELLPPGPAFPLGIASETLYMPLEAQLAPGDTLVFVTDGLIEAHNSERQMFGFERLEQLVAFYGDQVPEALVEIMLQAVSGFIGSAAQHDDITIMVVQIG